MEAFEQLGHLGRFAFMPVGAGVHTCDRVDHRIVLRDIGAEHHDLSVGDDVVTGDPVIIRIGITVPLRG